MTERKQVVPKGAMAMEPPASSYEDFRHKDEDLANMVEDLIGAIRQDLVPTNVLERLFSEFNPAIKRTIIAEEAGLDSTILMSLKRNMQLIEAILRRTFNDDGSTKKLEDGDMGMNPKDVMNLNMKVTQTIVRELPKIYTVERYQKQEAAILEAIKTLPPEAQSEFLNELDRSTRKLG